MEEIINTQTESFEKKVDNAMRVLKAYNKQHNLVLAYSGGKDSDICRVLCKMCNIKVDLVYNCTTIDPPHTISRCQHFGAYIQRPKRTFLQLMQIRGIPAINRRWCCDEFKEHYIAPHVITGVRQDESKQRAQRYDGYSSCFKYTKKLSTEQIHPIVFFSDDDVKRFIEDNNMTLHPDYYDHGQIDYSRRLGCIGCPLTTDRGRTDFLKYPKMLKLWVKAYTAYVEKNKPVEGVYEDIVYHLFYSNNKHKQYNQAFHGLFQPPNAKQLLEDYFKIKL